MKYLYFTLLLLLISCSSSPIIKTIDGTYFGSQSINGVNPDIQAIISGNATKMVVTPTSQAGAPITTSCVLTVDLLECSSNVFGVGIYYKGTANGQTYSGTISNSLGQSGTFNLAK